MLKAGCSRDRLYRKIILSNALIFNKTLPSPLCMWKSSAFISTYNIIKAVTKVIIILAPFLIIIFISTVQLYYVTTQNKVHITCPLKKCLLFSIPTGHSVSRA